MVGEVVLRHGQCHERLIALRHWEGHLDHSVLGVIVLCQHHARRLLQPEFRNCRALQQDLLVNLVQLTQSSLQRLLKLRKLLFIKSENLHLPRYTSLPC